ncbi:hypothetical protein [Proteus mirabilis]|uniref:hypothetical protein n=1 Tax=Proteus mirabilis TaxID=584 RepID=UPI0034D4D306
MSIIKNALNRFNRSFAAVSMTARFEETMSSIKVENFINLLNSTFKDSDDFYHMSKKEVFETVLCKIYGEQFYSFYNISRYDGPSDTIGGNSFVPYYGADKFGAILAAFTFTNKVRDTFQEYLESKEKMYSSMVSILTDSSIKTSSIKYCSGLEANMLPTAKMILNGSNKALDDRRKIKIWMGSLKEGAVKATLGLPTSEEERASVLNSYSIHQLISKEGIDQVVKDVRTKHVVNSNSKFNILRNCSNVIILQEYDRRLPKLFFLHEFGVDKGNIVPRKTDKPFAVINLYKKDLIRNYIDSEDDYKRQEEELVKAINENIDKVLEETFVGTFNDIHNGIFNFESVVNGVNESVNIMENDEELALSFVSESIKIVQRIEQVKNMIECFSKSSIATKYESTVQTAGTYIIKRVKEKLSESSTIFNKGFVTKGYTDTYESGERIKLRHVVHSVLPILRFRNIISKTKEELILSVLDRDDLSNEILNEEKFEILINTRNIIDEIISSNLLNGEFNSSTNIKEIQRRIRSISVPGREIIANLPGASDLFRRLRKTTKDDGNALSLLMDSIPVVHDMFTQYIAFRREVELAVIEVLHELKVVRHDGSVELNLFRTRENQARRGEVVENINFFLTGKLKY